MPLLADIAGNLTNTLDTVSDVTGAKQVGKLANKATDYLAEHSAQLIGGTIVLVIGIVVAGWIARAMAHALEKRQTLEPPERLLIIVVARLLMLGLTVTVALDVCGYPIGAVIGGLSVLAVGVGFAMQGLLGNIIAGLTLIFTKPFRVGEYIEILGTQGMVTHIDIVSTTMRQLDHSKVVIPNHKIVGEVLHNFGTVRQLNLAVGVGYQTDLKQARDLAAKVLVDHKHVLQKPEPMVAVGALRDSAIALSIKFWVRVHDYEIAEGEINEAIIECFRQNKIELPYPQRDVRIVNSPAGR
jgi:small conductance mechanosensitive channel